MEQAQNNSSFIQNHSNINLLWASLFIEELVRNGVVDFCIAPGSRSTPLTLAAANHSKVQTHLHFDERGLGFFALGLSLASCKPVVVITTSGTAVANLYPAVIEAKQSAVPLIILSADRPPELIDCGANQAIDQHAIFANYPVFFRQVPSPCLEISPNYLLTTVNQGLFKQQSTPAPIHFNLAFPEPLYPDQQSINYQDYLSTLQKWLTDALPYTRYSEAATVSEKTLLTELANKKVLVIAGRLKDSEQALAIAEFANNHNYPLLADIQSSISAQSDKQLYYDLLLANPSFESELAQADIIVQFGDKLTSKRLNQFISSFNGEYWLIQPGEQCIDPDHQLNRRFNCDAKRWIEAQTNQAAIEINWLNKLNHCHQQISQQIITPFLSSQQFSEMHIVDLLDNLLPIEAPLFIGNSMPIRLCDMLMKNNRAQVFTNRGASGIDGLLATAVGVAKNSQQPSTLLIGDTSFLYDLNSLALLKQLNQPFIIIVINNDGGAIFNLLPVPSDHKQAFYQLPHGLTFADSCKQFSIDYYQAEHLHDFKKYYKEALTGKATVIEINVANQQTATQLKQLKAQIKNATL